MGRLHRSKLAVAYARAKTSRLHVGIDTSEIDAVNASGSSSQKPEVKNDRVSWERTTQTSELLAPERLI